MSRVNFKIDIERDAKNYYYAANSTSKWGYDFTKTLRPEVLIKLKGKKWKEVKGYIVKLLKKGYSQSNNKNKLAEIEKSWREIEKRCFYRLKKITGHPIYRKNFTCFITTIGRCPYDLKENWFMINILSKKSECLITILHELMHFQFHYYFERDLLKKLSKEKFNDLKEALTVLLNSEFKDMSLPKGRGYPSHKNLRNFILKEWKKEKDFGVLIDKCVNYLKKI